MCTTSKWIVGMCGPGLEYVFRTTYSRFCPTRQIAVMPNVVKGTHHGVGRAGLATKPLRLIPQNAHR